MDGLLMNADDNDSEGKDGEGQVLVMRNHGMPLLPLNIFPLRIEVC
jgi:hypothetical protein